jgi:phosphate-selective porin OprO/OprP
VSLLAAAPSVRAEDPAGAPPKTLDETAEAGEADALEPPKPTKWNEYDGSVSTFRFGFGFLLDFATYGQDAESKEQVTLQQDMGVRDFRLLFKGKFKTDRPMTWTLGYMYDAADGEWRFRQTGIQIGFPKARGNLFIGRTKEGYSMVKVMVGYHGWTMERSPSEDAFVPILADGLKWMGYFPKSKMFFSFGVFGDELSESEKFSTYDHQIVTRVGWRPILSEENRQVLHFAVMARDGKPDENSIQVRSRPEANLAPYFLDTGKFAADHATTTGIEAYYRKGPWLVGGEYNWLQVDALSGEKPTFHGGDVVATWIITGETRAYNEAGGYFTAVSPERPAFQGGLGAFEAVLHFSYADFDSGTFQGGKLWRITPMLNWHLSDNLRFEVGYGYSQLDRFDLHGHTQFFQARLQITL